MAKKAKKATSKSSSKKGKKSSSTQSVIVPKTQDISLRGIIVLCSVLLAISVVCVSYVAKQQNASKTVTEALTPTRIPLEIISYDGWNEVPTTTENAILKLEKESTAAIKPSIVLIISEAGSEDNAAYVDSLIKGAQSAIPSLTFTKNTTEEKDGFYARHLQGTFLNGKTKVNNMQSIYVKNGKVYTLTGSYTAQMTAEEMQAVMEEIYTKRIR